jgi:methylthioribose-1-phosphate isomerase
VKQRTIDWADGAIVIVDQCALPAAYQMLRLTSVDELISAIRRLAVRGAPALGAAGALGVALAAFAVPDPESVREQADRLAAARPTAVNLAWGVRRALERVPEGPQAVLDFALELLAEDERVNQLASGRAAELIRELCPHRPLRLSTHCNAGHLATVGWGTALGVVWHLQESGEIGEVFVDETRPLLQGSRITAYELHSAGVPYRICPDGATASALAQGLVDCVVVGADRVAANGDVANKVGTYPLALAAARHGVPFVVVAPESTLDPDTPTGAAIPIEQRSADEVTAFGGTLVAPEGSAVYNPAFDVTPRDLVTALVTEARVLR